MAHNDGSVCESIVILGQDEGLSANAGGGWRSVHSVHSMSVATEIPEG